MIDQNATRSKLQAALKSADKTVEQSANEVVVKFRRFLRRYLLEFRSVLSDLDLASTKELISLAEQEQMVAMVTSILADAGYSDVVEEFRESLAAVGDEAISYYRDFVDNQDLLRGVSRETLDLLAEPFLDELDFEVDRRLIRPIETQVRNSFLTLKTREEIVRELAAFIDRETITTRNGREFTITQIETLVHESDRRYMELVRGEQAKNLELEVFVYSGPLDKVTSEQCEFLLTEAPHGAPGMWYRDEIKVGMHPELKENPLVARGHYNCRHQWLPVDEESAARIDPSFKPRKKKREKADA